MSALDWIWKPPVVVETTCFALGPDGKRCRNTAMNEGAQMLCLEHSVARPTRVVAARAQVWRNEQAVIQQMRKAQRWERLEGYVAIAVVVVLFAFLLGIL